MLCRAEFLQVVGAREAAGEDETGRVMIYVSVRAILGSGGSDSPTRVMALDGELVRSREVKLGKEERDGYRLVLSGLLPGDRVVLDPAADLADGDRVKPVVESENPLE